MIVRAKAPMRISFGGGGTDTSPYMEEFGGCVISTTIDKYAYVSIEEIEDERIELVSIDFGSHLGFPLSSDLTLDGQLDLVKMAINKILPSSKRKQGVKITTFSETPPGSGLGSSSTMMVALVGALMRYAGLIGADKYNLAELAVWLERVELGIKGGQQDQYAAVFGGFNFIEFGSQVVVNSLRINQDILNELHYHLVLVNTGDVRNAGKVSAELVKPTEKRPRSQIEASHKQKQLAANMKNALVKGALHQFGELLHEGWLLKKKMSSAVTNPKLDAIYSRARSEGAIGGKLLGAGGGGHMLFFVDPYRRRALEASLTELGCSVVEFAFDFNGLVTWQINASPLAGLMDVAATREED